mmetsp:Transcript_33408/g.38367  ORF Transcript_33408/g.38367 Transcript_33408/m.38367 type:complete len:95 (+) Transcript_33408:142-426(+)
MPKAHDCMNPFTREISKIRMKTRIQSRFSSSISSGSKTIGTHIIDITTRLALIVRIGGKYLWNKIIATCATNIGPCDRIEITNWMSCPGILISK